jgi:hypothetical protein
VAKHQAEQPDNPAGARIVGKVDDKACEVDLGLDTRRCLEAHLVGLRPVLRSDRGKEALHRSISAGVAEFADFAGQSSRAQIGERDDPLAQKLHKRCEFARPAH